MRRTQAGEHRRMLLTKNNSIYVFVVLCAVFVLSIISACEDPRDVGRANPRKWIDAPMC